MTVLRSNLFGVDRNPTACRIAAFSLYLALLDQLSPPDIQELQRKGRMLPPVSYSLPRKCGLRTANEILSQTSFLPRKRFPAIFIL